MKKGIEASFLRSPLASRRAVAVRPRHTPVAAAPARPLPSSSSIRRKIYDESEDEDVELAKDEIKQMRKILKSQSKKAGADPFPILMKGTYGLKNRWQAESHMEVLRNPESQSKPSEDGQQRW